RNYTHLVEGIVVELSCFKLQKPSSICKYLTVLLSEQDFFSGLVLNKEVFYILNIAYHYLINS
ncbi:hypothetical protein, partial [Tenacibaculum maritimum]|uniref:hypothetical protein n=1 Tax=Tenacibaculum maritimum TaxID=107401 RepID=UPI001F27BB88